jgi:hypothetical protein
LLGIVGIIDGFISHLAARLNAVINCVARLLAVSADSARLTATLRSEGGGSLWVELSAATGKVVLLTKATDDRLRSEAGIVGDVHEMSLNAHVILREAIEKEDSTELIRIDRSHAHNSIEECVDFISRF